MSRDLYSTLTIQTPITFVFTAKAYEYIFNVVVLEFVLIIASQMMVASTSKGLDEPIIWFSFVQ